MRYLKLFENFEDIDQICKKYGITNYIINKDGTVDVDGDVDIRGEADFLYLPKTLTKLPLKFGKVTGYFDCGHNQLTSLEGSPQYVGGYFDCGHNQLTSLEGGPNKVNDNFFCSNNKLTSLVDGPKEVGGDFYCSYNQLISLDVPNTIGSVFYCEGNPIYNIYDLFDDYEKYQDSLDYNYLRGTDIIKFRFREALEEIGEEVPDKIEGYNYI